MSSHAYSLDTAFTTRPGVSVEQIAEALAPLAGAFSWPHDWVTTGQDEFGEGVHIEPLQGGGLHVDIHMQGEGPDDTYETFEKCAKNLSPLVCDATMLEFRDHDTGDLENAISRHWCGPAVAVQEAKRKFTALEIRNLARLDMGYCDTQRNLLQAIAHSEYTGQTLDRILALPENLVATCCASIVDREGGTECGQAHVALTRARLVQLALAMEGASSLDLTEACIDVSGEYSEFPQVQTSLHLNPRERTIHLGDADLASGSMTLGDLVSEVETALRAAPSRPDRPAFVSIRWAAPAVRKPANTLPRP